MTNSQSISDITEDVLLKTVQKKWDEGARLVVIICSKTEDGFEILYTFEKEQVLDTLRLKVTGKVVPSISGIYLCAFSHENEIADLYGLTFDGLVLNYQGRYLITSVPHPFGEPSVTVKKGGES